MSNTLEYTVHFISEQQTELYNSTVKGVAQLKNVLGTKNTLQWQTCSGLERCGV